MKAAACRIHFLAMFVTALSGAVQNTTPETPPAGPVLRTTTHAVVLDITVTDHHGNPVPDLTKDDFIVLEDRTPQAIASFESSTTTTRVEGSAPTRTVILIDELNTDFVDIAYARYSLEKFLKHDKSQLEGPAQLLTLNDKGLSLVHEFTQNGAELLASVEHLPPRLPFKLSLSVSGVADRMNLSLGALEQIALANQKSGKRTAIVWVSPGYPVPDKAWFDPVEREHFENAVRNLSQELLDSRTTIYSIDPRGVMVDNPVSSNTTLALGSSGAEGFGDMALGRLAIESGGRAFFGRNDVDNLVATSLLQSSSFYTLSYYPSNANYDGRFRSIQVELKPRALAAHTRSGYYALPDDAARSVAQITLEVERAMLTPLAYTAIPVLNVAEIAGESSKRKLDLTVDGNALAWEPQQNGDFRFHVMVGVAEYAADEFLDWRTSDLNGHLTASQMENATVKNVHLRIDQPENPKASSFRLAVCDFKTGLVGTANMKK